jgi:hypothetical protein
VEGTHYLVTAGQSAGRSERPLTVMSNPFRGGRQRDHHVEHVERRMVGTVLKTRSVGERPAHPILRRSGTKSSIWSLTAAARRAQGPGPTRVTVVTLIMRNPRANLTTMQVSPCREKLHRNGARVSWVP